MIKERYKTERMGSNGKVVYLWEGSSRKICEAYIIDGHTYHGLCKWFDGLERDSVCFNYDNGILEGEQIEYNYE